MSDDNTTPPNLSPPENETQVNIEDTGYEDLEQLLSKIKLRYDDGIGAFEENRRMHSEDLNFVYNSESMGQWDPVVLEARRGKPCYTFNRVLGPVNIVVADMRQTRPAGKVRPTNESASEATATVLAGLMRSIEDESRADPIYKNQYKFAVAGGFGAWRLMPEWAAEDSFDQVLRIKDIPNPQTVIWDPECNDACAGDAMWCLIGERISKEKYRSLFPKADPDPITFHISRDSYGWFTDKEVRIVEYMERVPFEKEIVLMKDGTVQDYTKQVRDVDDAWEKAGIDHPQVNRIATDHKGVHRVRKVLKWRVMWVKASGSEILEGPIFYDWKRIPVVRVPGRYINIEGRKKLQSLVRHSKDAQRNYNSRLSDMIERSALTPKAPYLVTEAMVKGYEAEWSQANTASRPYLPYHFDRMAAEAGAPGIPERTPPIDIPQAALALAQSAAQDIQATTGYFDPALGNAEDMNRVSGKALIQHTRRSDLGSFEFIDGFSDALQLTWEMGIDMIPTIYDSERVVRIVGNDDTEKMVQVNTADPKSGDIIHDLKVGSYATKVTIGPSYQTARQEALATLIDAAEAMPMLAQIAPDIIAKNMDIADADELSRRLRIPLIQQGIIQPTEAEKGTIPPPPQNPMQQAQMQREMALARRDSAQADITQHKAGMLQLETEKQVYEVAGKHLANLKTAHDMGNDQAGAQAEQQAQMMDLAQQHVQGMQELAQSHAAHQQDLMQQSDQHTLDMHKQVAQHQVDMATQAREHTLGLQMKVGAHRTEMAHKHESHKQTMAHQEESHKEEVKATKAMAKAKPKSSGSSARKKT